MNIPEHIGRYRVERLLGAGGMAAVFLAQDPLMRRKVAIKLLPRHWTFDDRLRQRFHQEAQLVASLEHPAIVPVYDFGEHDEQPFLVMRYMAGGSLRTRLEQPLTLREASRVLDRLSQALDEAHARGIIHRDLKPDNVLFDEANRPYLADFGIARMAEATKSMTIIGTPAYMSPEQVQGNRQLDARSDIYALGVTLFEMATGRAPYQADTPPKLMYQHVYEPVPEVRMLNPELPAGIQHVIARALAKNPEERFSSAGALAEAVRSLARSPAGGLAGPGFAETVIEMEPSLPRMPRRKRYAAFAVGTLLLLAFLLTAGIFLSRGVGSSASLPVVTVATLKPDAVGVAAKTSTLTRQGVPTELPASTTTPTVASPHPVLSPTAMTIAAPVVAAPDTVTPPPSSPPEEAERGAIWIRPVDDMPMVYAPPGEFVMGSTAAAIDEAFGECLALFSADACPRDWFSDEGPLHPVSLSKFWIDRTEVTNAQFAVFLYANGNQTEEGTPWLDMEDADALIVRSAAGFEPRQGFANHPAIEVSWHGAAAYCAWVGGALPTEAQWEYAARGPAGSLFPWGDAFDGNRLNFCDANCTASWRDPTVNDGYERTAPVGTYPDGASWLGVLDMSGNVWEWLREFHEETYYARSPVQDPQGAASGEFRAMRGGSWDTIPIYLRAANRSNSEAESTLDDGGFRCVVTP